MSSRHEIIATYRGTLPTCVWENDDGSQTIIAKVEFRDGRDDTIKGIVFPNQLVRGLQYRFYGGFKQYRGKAQFVFESFVAETPSDEESIVAYLTQCNGIGPVMARSIFAEFKESAVEMLRECPETVARRVKRLKVDVATEASRLLKKSEQTERTKIDLMGLLKGRGFPKRTADKLIEDYGAEAAHVVARNPYMLMRYKGCGFKKTDDMYLALGHRPGRAKRQALCAWHSIARQSSGDTWFPFSTVRDHLRQNIASAAVDVERAMALAVRAGILSERFEKGQRWVAERAKDVQERTIAERLDEARREFEEGIAKLMWQEVADRLEDVTEHQRENARLATSSFITVLAGRPGTGKTYTVARIVRILCDLVGSQFIAIAAPTGKAAVRVTAAMAEIGLPLRATTLHSLLGWQGERFSFTREHPLEQRFIIVDESSMIDAAMMRALLDARAEGAHILFVGDPNQLAPVGHGAPLRDLILANVPHGELKEIQRNSGRIVRACSDIIDHSRLIVSPSLDLPSGENLVFLDREGAESQIDTLAALMQRFQRDFSQGVQDAVDPIWDCQVIVAVNAKSDLGRKPLNKKLQDLLNPDGRRVEGNPFRVGDKIINTKNSEYKLVVSEFVPSDPWQVGQAAVSDTAYVANGEQAEVIDVDTTKIIARLTSPDRTIIIPRSAKNAGDQPSDDEAEDASGTGCYWELGYAISGHKSQGSEWKHVIVMIDDYNGAKLVQSKQYIYTTISRAKRICFLIGQMKTASQCCHRDALFDRKTFLRERIIRLRERIEFSDEVVSLLLQGI